MKKLFNHSLLALMVLATLVFVSCGDDEGTTEVMLDAGTISGGPFNFTVDGTPDFVSGISVSGADETEGSSWIITDGQNNILGTPGTLEMLEGVDFDGAGVGVCFIWYIVFEGDLTGFVAGTNNVDDIAGSFAISNSITVNRNGLNAGTISGGPFTFVVDGTEDNVSGIELDATNVVGENGTWVITDEQDNILGLPGTIEMVEGVNFDGAGAGVCFIWYMRYGSDIQEQLDLVGMEGQTVNIDDLDDDYFALSNSIEVTRNALNAGTISGGPFTFVVDGVVDNVSGITIDNSAAMGANSSWVITDEDNKILGTPGTLEMVEGVDFDGAGAGVCFIWYMRYGDNLQSTLDLVGTEGEEVFVEDLTDGQFALSNSIMVTRNVDGNINLDLSGLEDLGSEFAYEGWVIVDGSPVSTGTFTVDANGSLSATSFAVNGFDLVNATKFVLSIEPVPDNDPAPAATKILEGDFSGSSASLATTTVGTGFDNSTGKYIIATPTGTGDPSEEFSGIWFLDNSGGAPVAGLDLPELQAGWKYEGWVVIDGTPVTTGTFTSVTGSDEAAPFSGSNPGPSYPGEDFLVNAPDGLTFPTDLRGATAVISIEPYPDNSTAPFALKPLVGAIPASLSGNPYDLGNNVSASFPTGSVSR